MNSLLRLGYLYKSTYKAKSKLKKKEKKRKEIKKLAVLTAKCQW